MMNIKEVLLLWFTNFLIKSPLHLQINLLRVVLLQCLQITKLNKIYKELHKPIIKNFKIITVYSGFKDNIQGADLADMQLISKFNKEFRFLLCVIDTFSKYAWVVSLKDKKGVAIVNAFQKTLDDSTRKPNKIWVHKGSEFYNNFF